jgi:hypothetical protein
MNININVVKEGLVVGVFTLIIGLIIKFLIDSIIQNNRDYNFAIILFLTAFSVHLIYQFAGINKWYCSNGDACLLK